jgi:uncharacterized membrane protein required for colicin V production
MISELNWIDVIFLILLLGMIYKGVRLGVAGQIIPLLGTFVVLFLSIRYYKSSSEAFFGSMLQGWAKPVSFFIISSLVLFISKIIDKLFHFTAPEDMAVIERAAGIIIAAIRTAIICGVISLGLFLIPVKGVNSALKQDSQFASRLAEININIYCMIAEISDKKKKVEKEKLLSEFLNKRTETSNKTSGD